MRPVLTPPFCGGVVDERRDEPVGSAAGFRVLAVEDDADDMVHFSHTDDESADKVE